jgi:hypothetical protein
VIPSIFGESGSVSTSFKISKLDGYFWKFLFLTAIVISSNDKWRDQILTCGGFSMICGIYVASFDQGCIG